MHLCIVKYKDKEINNINLLLHAFYMKTIFYIKNKLLLFTSSFRNKI